MSRRDERAAGAALDGTTLTIVWRNTRANGAWRSQSAPCDGTPDGIALAIGQLADSVPREMPMTITLLRPLANARILDFPSMARTALETILARDWTRYVIGARATPHTGAARQIARNHWRAAFAPTDTLEAIAAAADENDWKDLIVQTSDDALASAVRALAADRLRASDQVVIVCDGRGPVAGVHLSSGEPVLGRRFLEGAPDEDALAFLEAASNDRAPVVVIGEPVRAVALARSIESSGRQVRVLDIGAGADNTAEGYIAIAGTLGSPALPLLSPSAHRTRGREMRSLTRWLWIVAAAAFIAAFAIEWWGVSAALGRVQQQRAEISAQVSNAMTARSGVEADADVAAALADRETTASKASGVIAAVAVALPNGTSLTTLSVTGDSMTIEGESKRSAAVYDALRALPALEQVRLAAPLRQERQAGDVAIERFAFYAHIRSTPGASR